MVMRVRYLSEEVIERDAETLLAEYSSARDVVLQPPIPVEDIVEKHLKLRIGFDDLHQLLGVPQTGLQPDIFGAIWMDEGEIVIHECLDPDEWPTLEGRYRFTLAHEGGGHWRLHRPYLAADRAQGASFNCPSKPTVVCRSSQAKERVEWQADFYASCRSRVFGVWHQRFGNTNARRLKRKCRLSENEIDDPALRAGIGTYERSWDDQVLEEFVRPFAKRFGVSPIAMRIRLEKLGLLLRDEPCQRSLTGAA